MMTSDEWRSSCERELGKPYIWGASGPQAYDCSGFAQWALAQLNLDPPGDQTADGLYRFFKRQRSTVVQPGQESTGDIVFFGSDEAVTHIALAWGDGNMLEAGGGGRKTTTVEIAKKQHAEVRIKPISRRNDLVEILRPTALAWPSGLELDGLEAALGHGRYENAPPLTEWLEDGRNMRLKKPFGYVQEDGRSWPVPSEIVVDGASIPQVFWSMIGGPFEGLYRYASIVHDHYCVTRTQPWEDVHKVFYEGMLCSGVSVPKAKVLYYAVYRFGPRWKLEQQAVVDGFESAVEPQAVAVSLQTEPFDAASFEADASLIYATDPVIGTIEAIADTRSVAFADLDYELEAALPFEVLKPKYEALYATCSVRPERRSEVAWYVSRLVQYRPRYEAVAARTGAPWWFIGVVHALEGSFSFKTHLHNGDPLSARTVQVPANRPAVWNPPNDWESSAVDAITYEKLAGLSDWSVATALFRWEAFNGFGYYAKKINSPYLWSFSNQYTKGKFVRDRVYDPEAVSKQCGAAVMLRALADAGLVRLP